MRRLAFCVSLPILAALLVPLSAQDRVKPKSAKGGSTFGEPWKEVPEAYKKLRIPDWTLPTEPSKRRIPYGRPDTGAYLLVVSILSLGLWAAIWGTVASLAAVLG